MEDYMEERLNLLKTNAFITLFRWTRLGETAGSFYTIVTNDGNAYFYHNYTHETAKLRESNISKEGLSEAFPMGEDKINELVSFINDNVIGKEYSNEDKEDSLHSVTINYNGSIYFIKNDLNVFYKLKEIIDK